MFLKLLLYFVIFISLGIAQNVQVSSIEKVTELEDGEFFHPKFTPDGNSLIFTKSNYLGIFKKNFMNTGIEELNILPGAGYEPLISDNSEYIYCQANKYIEGRKYTSLIRQNIRTGESIIVEDYGRHQVLPTEFSGNRMSYQKNTEIISLDISNQKLNKTAFNGLNPLVLIERGNLVVYNYGIKRILKPLGEGHYLWPSLSPDKKRLLFTKSGDGAYISDLNGNIEFSLGYANAPKWSPDGRWISYMDDKDDGHQYLSSEIYITSIDGENRFRLTEGESIDMFPSWSPDSRKIAFHTIRGEIYLINLQFDGGNQ
jgi:Tol biopolymer transport system component